ncbi:MAG: biotin--[acetyl-CoA-carboxylase] ligase [Desulfovermiculus sp.]
MSSPKTQILTTLMHATWISGQALADAAGISRTAIWKHIHTLREEGYPIQASSGRGYRLEYIPDRLGAEAVQAGLRTTVLGQRIVSRPEIDSTQNLAKVLGQQGALEGTVVLAESQTKGRGRRGRAWSAIPKGVAMSVILRPDISPDQAPHFPLMAGVAVGRAISMICNLIPGLKWPNDILIQGLKVVGILAELDAEMDRINAIYLGIGLNVNATHEDIPEELASTATSLRIQSGNEIDRLSLVRSVLEELEAAYFIYMSQGFSSIRQAWKDHNITLGQKVRIRSGNMDLTGTALDMDASGALLVRTQDNTERAITAGEVHLCPQL